jgi:hypothetical protein
MEPEYEEQFTAFIDFLGFSEASTKTDDATRLKVLDLLLSLTLLRGEFDIKSTAHETGTTHHIKPAISTFSDHIVISYPLNAIQTGMVSDERATVSFIVFSFQRLLAAIAAAALRIGFLVRGGATVGKLYHARGVVFGEAMVDAFQLESRTSVYPRVVLSGSITRRWTWIDTEYGIIRDNDGLYHVDYFTQLLLGSAPPGPVYLASMKAFFGEVIETVSRNLKELAEAGKLNELAKWAWFAHQLRSGLERLSPQFREAFGLSLDVIPWPK